jgi:tRNA (guanine37-N1)-methyltransferase
MTALQVDIVTLFPNFFAPLQLSLSGKAQVAGLLEINVYDLRRWAHDPHRTTDDSPYGGGPGMVMKPEPWGEALDELGLDNATLIVPTPSGQVFTQTAARELAAKPRLIVACGRYEGIDQRVIDYASTRTEVREISLGDYVINGGEAAALVLLEAIARLVPGFVGNPESLVEESHESGLLEYPNYTKPVEWRGFKVPAVLRSGDHGAIAAWRREQALQRTAARRPDLVSPTSLLSVIDAKNLVPRLATPADVPELHVLTLACWVAEAQLNNAPGIPPLRETAEQRLADLRQWRTWVVRHRERLIGSVRGRLVESTWEIGRLMVAPDLQGKGLGRALLQWAEFQAPANTTAIWLITGSQSSRNLKLYKKAGYRRQGDGPPGTVRLEKRPRKLAP